MGKLNSLFFLLLILLVQPFDQLSGYESTAIKHLPGFQGPLPFYLETGYIGVGEAEESQLFYYFVKSERNAEQDPLLLWLSGGPGCSSLSGLFFEIGPLQFEQSEYNGSLPTLILRPQTSWTQVSSIIFLETPAGTGFSYSTNPAVRPSDTLQASHVNEFLRKWLMTHSEFMSNPLYIGGDSYSGITIPPIVQQLVIGIEEGKSPMINLKGYMIGNPVTGNEFHENARIPFAHGMGLISDEFYKSLEESCGGEYHIVSPTNLECLNNLKVLSEFISGLNNQSIADPACGYVNPLAVASKRKFLQEDSSMSLDVHPLLNSSFCTVKSADYGFLLCTYWANDERVRNALHVREMATASSYTARRSVGFGYVTVLSINDLYKLAIGQKSPQRLFCSSWIWRTVEEWRRCNIGRIDYEYDIPNSFNYHVYLSTKGYRSLIYSGDHDYVVPFLGTQAWIRALNYSIIHDWRSWHVDDQVGGYTRTYSNGMTFATVKGGMHVTPQNRPLESYTMFRRWINYESL